LNKLTVRSKLCPDQRIDRELYSLVYTEMLIYAAYEKIKSQPTRKYDSRVVLLL